MLVVEQELGEAGYARLMKLQEIMAEFGGSGADFSPRIDTKKRETSLKFFAQELGISPKKTKISFDLFAEVGLMDPKAWTDGVIHIPEMLALRDEWASRRKGKDSGVTPESLGSDSGKSRVEQSRVEQNARSRSGPNRGPSRRAQPVPPVAKPPSEKWDACKGCGGGVDKGQEFCGDACRQEAEAVT
jgi:hypothetical protein